MARHSLRYFGGALRGGDGGRLACQQAVQALQAEGYRNPLSALRCWGLPALDALTEAGIGGA